MTDDVADELLERLNGIRRVVRRRLRAELPMPPIGASQAELLGVVEASPGIGVAAAARAMRLAGNSVSALVNQLNQAGYLNRDIDPADRRVARLGLTPAATSRLKAWRSQRSALVGAALAGLSAADRRTIEDALPALRRLAEALTDGEPPPADGAATGTSATGGPAADGPPVDRTGAGRSGVDRG